MKRTSITSKTLSILLSIVMVVSMTPLAWADEADEESGTAVSDATVSEEEGSSVATEESAEDDNVSVGEEAGGLIVLETPEAQEELVDLATDSAVLAELAATSPESASASDAELADASGDWTYSIEDNQATITRYSGTATEVEIPSEIDGYTVTAIGDYAFKRCRDISSISIPASVASIGDYAFGACTSLASIDIPASVASIGMGSFYWCTSLASIDIPASVASIGDYAFYGCTSLGSIDVETGNTAYRSINGVLFDASVTSLITYPAGCESASYETPATVTSISDGAFAGSTSLSSVSFDESFLLASIGNSAFIRCTSLSAVDIPASIASIGENAFDSCTSLTSVTFTEDSQLSSIGGDAFSGCESLESVSFPKGSLLASIGEGAFSYCESLESVSFAKDSQLSSIGGDAFNSCTSLSAIDIPASVTSIGSYAFYGCSSLASIDVETGSTAYRSINGVLFDAEATSLVAYPAGGSSGYDIPTSVTSIGGDAFNGCSSLTSIDIPASVTSIGGYAFSGCSSLTSIDIPASVTSIGGYAFYGVPAVSAYGSCGDAACYVLYSDGLLQITGSGAMASYSSSSEVPWCSSLASVTSVSISDAITSISSYAFYGCSSLASASVPVSVTSIGSYAFSGCSSLASIDIPVSMTSVGGYAFMNVPAVKAYGSCGDAACYVLHSDGLLQITGSGAMASCSSPSSVPWYGARTLVTSVSIPDTITSISSYAFYGCSSLTTLTVPAGLDMAGSSLREASWRNEAGEEYVRTAALVAANLVAAGESPCSYSYDGVAACGAIKNAIVLENGQTSSPVALGLNPALGLSTVYFKFTAPSDGNYYFDNLENDGYFTYQVYLDPFGLTQSYQSGTFYGLSMNLDAGEDIWIKVTPSSNCSYGNMYNCSIAVSENSGSGSTSKYISGYGWSGGYAYFYTGSEIYLSITSVRGWNGSSFVELTEGVDYRLEYSDNVIGSPTETVEAYVKIVGIGEYAAAEGQYEHKVTYYIVPFVDLSNPCVALNLTEQGKTVGTSNQSVQFLHTGEAIKPAVVLSASNVDWQEFQKIPTGTDGISSLAEGIDYSIGYFDESGNAVEPTECGVYTVKVTALEGGKLRGETTTQFFIVDQLSIEEGKFYTSTTGLTNSGRYLIEGYEFLEQRLHKLDSGTIVGDMDEVYGYPSIYGASVFNSVYSDVYGSVYGNVLGDIDGNVYGTIVGDVEGDVNAHVDGVYGDVQGSVYGDVYSIVGDVQGDVVGSIGTIVGDVFGDIYGFVEMIIGNIYGTIYGIVGTVYGEVYGDVRGTIYGDVYGAIDGDVTGNVYGGIYEDGQAYADGVFTDVYGDVIGNVGGDVNADVTGSIFGDVFGNVYGTVYGSIFGNVDSGVSGTVYGDVTGDISSGVAGTVYGTVYGDVDGDITGETGDVYGDVNGDIIGTVADIIGDVFGDIYGFVGNIFGTVYGTIYGVVYGTVYGDVTGDVAGTVYGSIGGSVGGAVTGSVYGTVYDGLPENFIMYKGIGDYIGVRTLSVSETDYVSQFSTLLIYVGQSYYYYRSSYYDSIGTMEIDSNGLYVGSAPYLGNLIDGVDYRYAFYDGDGNEVDSFDVGSYYILRFEGLGRYEGGMRQMVLKAVASECSDVEGLYDLSKATIQIANGRYFNSSVAGSVYGWNLLSGSEPEVSASVSNGRSSAILQDGVDFTTTVTQGAEDNTLDITVTAKNPYTCYGEKTEAVRVVDGYDIALLAMRDDAYISYERNSIYDYSNAGSVTRQIEVGYYGYSFVPSMLLYDNISGYDTGRFESSYLAEGEDYSAVLRDAQNNVVDCISGPGVYTATLTGKGEWTGTVSVTITVTDETLVSQQLDTCCVSIQSPADANEFILTSKTCNDANAQTYAYAGGEVKPALRISYGDRVLAEGTDYTLEYRNNDAPGNAYALITAAEGGGFSGEIAVPYAITSGADLSSEYALVYEDGDGAYRVLASNFAVGGSYFACGKVTPAVALLSGSAELGSVSVARIVGGNIASAAGGYGGYGISPSYWTADQRVLEFLDPSCYTVEYGNNTEPGVAWIKVTGNEEAGYSGQLAANFYVVQAQGDLTNADVSGIANHNYTGYAIELPITVTLDGVQLTQDTDYSVVYANNKKIGTATVTITGIGHYTGSIERTFEITVPERTDRLNSDIEMSAVKFQGESAFDPKNPSDTTSVRFVAGIDGLGYESVGLLFSVSNISDENMVIGATGVSTYINKYAYSSINAGGQAYTAKDIFGEGYKYCLAVKMTGIPKSFYNKSMYVRAFAIKTDGTVVYSPVRSFMVETEDLESIDDSESGYGDLQ